MLMNVAEWPVQAMLDKYGRNKAWQVLRAKLDMKDKSLCIEIMLGADKSEVKHASYEDICREFSWKSFEVTSDGQTIIPMPDSEGFYRMPDVKQQAVEDADSNADNSTPPKRKRRGRKANTAEG